MVCSGELTTYLTNPEKWNSQRDVSGEGGGGT